MLGRPLRHLTHFLLATAVVLVPALVVAGSMRWLAQRGQEMLARQLADTFGREVVVGPVRGNLVTGAVVEGAALAARNELKDGAVLAADRITARYDLRSVVRRGVAVPAAISEVILERPRLLVVQDSAGRLNLQDIIPRVRPAPLEKRFRGKVHIRDGTLVFRSQAPFVRRGGLDVTLSGINGTLDLGRPPEVRGALKARCVSSQAGEVEVQLTVDPDSGLLALRASLDDVDLAWAARTFAPGDEFRILGGRGQLKGHVFVLPGEARPEVDFGVHATVHRLQARAAAIGQSPFGFSGVVWVGTEGVRIEQGLVDWAGGLWDIAGTVSHYAAPVVDLTVACDRLPATRLLPMLPQPVRREWELVRAGPISLDATIIGPASDPDIKALARAAGGLRARLGPWGEFQLKAAEVRASVVGLKKPAVVADAELTGLQAPSLRLTTDSETDTWPQAVSVAGGRASRVHAEWAGQNPTVKARLHVPAIRADALEIDQLTADVRLDRDIVQVPALTARTLGGELRGEGSVWLQGKEPSATFKGSLRGADLGRLYQLPVDLHAEIGGTANAEFRAQYAAGRVALNADLTAADVQVDKARLALVTGKAGATFGKDIEAIGKLTVRGVTYEKVQAAEGELLASLRGSRLDVAGGFLRADPGTLWVKGTADLDTRHLDAQVRLAEVDVREVSRWLGQEGLGGVAYFSGKVQGDWDDPTAQGALVVFEPSYQGYVWSGLTGDLSYQGDILRANKLYANLGPAVLRASGTIDGLREHGNEARIGGSVEAAGLHLERLGRFLGKDWPVSGLGTVEALVSGTVGRPEARGRLQLAHVQYEQMHADGAELTFRVDPEQLVVSAGTVQALGADVQVRGNLQFTEPAQLQAFLTAERVNLGALPVLLDLDLPLRGTVSIEGATVRGPVDNLTGTGRVLASEIAVADESVRDLEARLSLADGVLRLDGTRLSAAGGAVELEGSYTFGNESSALAGSAAVHEVGISPLLRLAVPLVQALEDRGEGRRTGTARQLRRWSLRLNGAIDGTVQVSGPVRQPEVRAELRTSSAQLDGKGLPSIEGRATLAGRKLRDVSVAMSQDQALLTAEGEADLDGPVAFTVEGSGISMAQLRPWLPRDVGLGGTLGFTVVVSGSARQPEAVASLDIVEPSLSGVKFDILTLPIATLAEGTIGIDTLVLKRGEQQVVLNGQLPFSWETQTVDAEGVVHRGPGMPLQGKLALGAKIEQTPLKVLPGIIAEYMANRGGRRSASSRPLDWSKLEAEGTLDSSVDITGTMADKEVRGFARITDGAFRLPEWRTAIRPVNVDVEFTRLGDENRVTVKRLDAGYQDLRAALTGQVIVPPALQRPDGTVLWGTSGLGRPLRNTYDLNLQLRAPQQVLPGGTTLRDLAGRLVLKTTAPELHRLEFQDLAAQVGKGKAQLAGQMDVRTLALPDLARNTYDLRLTMDRARLQQTRLLDTEADGWVELVSAAPGQMALRGRLSVHDGVFGLPPGDTGSPANLMGASGEWPAIGLDLQVALGDRITVRGAGMTVPLERTPTAAVLTGTPQEPRLRGGVTARRGGASLPVGRLTIEELTVDYSLAPSPGSTRIPRTLELRQTVRGRASTTVTRGAAGLAQQGGQVRIVMDISGALPDLVINATSDPPLSNEQILSLLAGAGLSPGGALGLQPDNAQALLSERVVETMAAALRAQVFAPLEEELQRLLGLSQLGITFAYDQPVSVQVGKYLVENLLVTYRHTFADAPSGYEMELSYRLPSGLSVNLYQREDGDSRFEIGYRRSF